MTRFHRDVSRRLERDLSQISDRATPSSTAWEAIRHRLAEQDSRAASGTESTVEVVMLDPDTERRSKRPRTGLLVAACLAGVAIVGGLVVIGTRDDGSAPADQPIVSPPSDDESAGPDGRTSDGVLPDVPGEVLPEVEPTEDWSMDAEGPGRFATTIADPGYSLSIPAGWVPGQPETTRGIDMEIPESSELGCQPCAFLTIFVATGESVDDVIEFGRVGGIEFGEPTELVVGGLPAQRFEVVGGGGVIAETEFSVFSVAAEERPRATFLEVDGQVVVIVELAMPVAVDRARADGDEIISSIEWMP